MITTFPHGSVHCPHGCATCKPGLMEHEGRGYSPIIFIGDGTSDQHAASRADMVFARKSKSLAQYCSDQKIPYIPFENFEEVRGELQRRLSVKTTGQPVPQAPFFLSYESES